MKTPIFMCILLATISTLIHNGQSISTNKAPPQILSAHVLDNEFGGNGVNMTCMLYRLEGTDFVHLSTQITDSVGRITEFLPLEEYVPGTYRIWFGTKDYYDSFNISTFFPGVQITFDVVDTLTDYHIPLVLSPYGFSTYRGS